MAQRSAYKYIVHIKTAPNLWWNIDKQYARRLVKKIYDEKVENRPYTDPTKSFYRDIGKHGLSRANVSAAVFGYCMVGYHFHIDYVQLGALIYGTYKCAIAANTYNQKHEISFDRQMERTRVRALVKRGTYEGTYLALHHAEKNALKSWLIGFTVLSLGCNPVVGLLGVFNVALYYKVYTMLKRKTWFNTQIGAIVGAIPPLMGYLANTGGEFVNAWWIIPSLTLFCWQFPHFYGLAESRNAEYAYAGYKMLGSTHPKSAMKWSAGNIIALAVIMALIVRHYFYLSENAEKIQVPENATDQKLPYYCSYIFTAGIFLAGMTYYQIIWWNGAKSAAYTIFGLSTAMITILVLSQIVEQLIYEYPYWKEKRDDLYNELRFFLYRYNKTL